MTYLPGATPRLRGVYLLIKFDDRDRRNALRRARPLSLLGTQNANSVKVWASLHFWSGLDRVSRSRAVRSPVHLGALVASGRRSMLLVLVHLRCVGAIFTGGRHHPRARSCAGLGHHCALAATVPNDPAFIDGAREALYEAVASACLVVSGRCEGCASCISLYCDSTGLGNTHQGRRAAHERSTRPVTTKSSHQKVHTP